jgi:hypothetical protein
MQKTITLAMLLVAAAGDAATAGGKEGSVGVGAEYGLNGETGGLSLSYDGGRFHAGGFLGFIDGGGDDDTDFTVGGRFYFHLHQTAMSDFGVGGGVGFYSEDQPLDADRQARLYFEPGIQFRAFVANNVALSFTAGLSFGLVDANGATINGQITGLAGVHYYFFQ